MTCRGFRPRAWRSSFRRGRKPRSSARCCGRCSRALSGDYTVYVAVYANDPATPQRSTPSLATMHEFARSSIRARGRRTKADNLNLAWRAMREDDRAAGARTRFVVLHDAEDVVHADELRVFDAMIGRYDVVQLPVRPLVRRGICLIAGTYSDELRREPCENAGRPHRARRVACRLPAWAARSRPGRSPRSRGRAAAHPSTRARSSRITRSGCACRELRFRSAFARVPDGSRRGVVATGEYFPDTLGAAVRQKARWMTGIALAGWDRTGWSARGGLVDAWMRMRDRRALLAMLVLAAAYVSAHALCGRAGSSGRAGRSARASPYRRAAPCWRSTWRCSAGGC